MIIGIPIISCLVSMIFFGITLTESVQCFWSNCLPSIFFTAIFWIGDRIITIQFRKRYPNPEEIGKRLYLQGITIVIYTALMSIPLNLSEGMFVHTFGPEVKSPSYLTSFIACFFATMLITTIYEAAFFINRWKLSIAEAEKLKKETVQAQLESLKNQVNPHFLFNSLNTLASIIPEDPIRSVEFVQKLSLVYRGLLDIREKSAVTLDEEMQNLENYLFLLKTRFGENLSFEISIAEGAKKKYLVPMSLQMLVENAIKHNIVSQRKQLLVKIYSGSDVVTVENNLQVKDQEQSGTKMGLQNIGNRYQLTFEKDIMIKNDGSIFSVSLPLISIEEYSYVSI